jgi:hypothetical protein
MLRYQGERFTDDHIFEAEIFSTDDRDTSLLNQNSDQLI